MNCPVDPALLKLVQDNVNKLSTEFDQEKMKVQQELKNVVQGLKDFQGDIKMSNVTLIIIGMFL